MRMIINPDVTIRFRNNAFHALIKPEKEAYMLTPLAYFVCKNADGRRTVADMAVELEAEFKRYSIQVPEDVDLTDEIKRVANVLSTKGIVFIE